MKVYIATGFGNQGQFKILQDHLALVGIDLTLDWTQLEENDPEVEIWHGDRMAQIAQMEIQAIEEADVVILLLPGGAGSHTELGLALAYQKPILVVPERATSTWQWRSTAARPNANIPDCPFYWAPEVVISRTADPSEIARHLRKIKEDAFLPEEQEDKPKSQDKAKNQNKVKSQNKVKKIPLDIVQEVYQRAGSATKAAKMLGVSRDTLSRWLKAEKAELANA